MELKDKRYEFDFEKVDVNSGIAIGVVATPDKTEDPSPFPKGMIGLVFMSEDKGDGKEHEIWGYQEFKSSENLRLAQMGLELIQAAIETDERMNELLEKE